MTDDKLFKNIGDIVHTKDFEESPVTEIESLCMECEKKVSIRLLYICTFRLISYIREQPECF